MVDRYDAQRVWEAAGIDDRKLLTVVGDSLTAGNSFGGAPGYWVKLVHAMHPVGWRVQRVALGGRTAFDYDPNETAGSMFGLEIFLQIPASDVVFYFIGTNDAAQGFDPDDHGRFVYDFARVLLRRGVERVILGELTVPPHFLKHWPERVALMESYQEQQRWVASALEGCEVMNFQFQDVDYDTDDDNWVTIHPLESGHTRLANAIIGAVGCG